MSEGRKIATLEEARLTMIQLSKVYKVAERYRDLLEERCEVVKCTPEDPSANYHLLWMLQEILHNEQQSITKKHRWLGCVQGIIIMKGYTSVQKERDATRDVFDGD